MRYILLILMLLLSLPVQAEAEKLRISRQYGINYLPLMVMEKHRLIEHELAALGEKNTTVEWVQVASSSSTVDAINTDEVDFGTAGPGPLIALWDSTREGARVKAVAALSIIPMDLVTNQSRIQSVHDFEPGDKIALPGAQVATQAIMLQMAAEKEFGNPKMLDAQTVTMSHPEAAAAMLSGKNEIVAHFGMPPYSSELLGQKGFRSILNSYRIMGGPSTANLVFAKTGYVEKNPHILKAFHAALEKAIAFLEEDKEKAAALYVEAEQGTPYTKEQVLSLLKDPRVRYTTVPQKMKTYADFMARTGLISHTPERWQDLFFDKDYDAEGS